jgi:hypothetical protein
MYFVYQCRKLEPAGKVLAPSLVFPRFDAQRGPNAKACRDYSGQYRKLCVSVAGNRAFIAVYPTRQPRYWSSCGPAPHSMRQ